MFFGRTDLAYEVNERYMKEHAPEGAPDGVETEQEDFDNLWINRIKIINENGSKVLDRPVGSYITIHVPDIRYDNEAYENACKKISEEIRRLVDITDNDRVLVVGLGNRSITPDALGHEVVSHIMVTNHIKEQRPELLGEDFRAVCAIAPGVLGMTGIESAEIIKSVCDRIKPKAVIVADALAAADFDRICTTFQICDTGIQPGAGVGNNRSEINEQTLNAKVIAIGVPTMIDAKNLMSDDMRESEGASTLMVTPRDIDLVIKKTGMTIAGGINLAVHKNVTLEDINEYVG